MEYCRNCWPSEACVVPSHYYVYIGHEWGRVKGEENFKKEIAANGPIGVSIAVTDEMVAWTPDQGIFCDTTGATDVDHAVTIVGYGKEGDQKYWLVQNSWGEYWGDNGFIKICRGVNNMMIEDDGTWITMNDTWTTPLMYNTTKEEQEDPANDKTVYEMPQPQYTGP